MPRHCSLSLRLLVAALAAMACISARAETYVWKPTSLYNGTHPTSTNPWSTEWAGDEQDDGTRPIRITVTRGDGYCNYIVIPERSLPNGATDFTVVLTFRVVTPPPLPKTFYMFARNTAGQAYDVWQRFTGNPGEQRTIYFPMQLPPIEGGEWTFHVGCQGMGSIIVDRLEIRKGRDLVIEQPKTAATTPDGTPPAIPLATGYKPATIDLPQGDTPRVVSAEGRLKPDADGPAEREVAEKNAIELQRLLDELGRIDGSTRLVIPKGVYRFAGRAPTALRNMHDLTIDGQGSEFIYEQLYSGELFALSNCTRLHIKDLCLDWNWDHKPIASLAKAVDADAEKRSFTLSFEGADAAKAAAGSDWMGMYPIDPETLYRARRIEPASIHVRKPADLTVDKDRIKVRFDRPLPLETGRTYLLRHLYYSLNGFKLSDSNHITFQNITIYSLPGMGWLTTGKSHHLHYDGCRIVRREGSRRPLTTAADGIHAGESAGNWVIENCVFTGLGDDAINLHDNVWQGGLERATATQVKLHNCPKHRLRIESGDVLEFFAPNYAPTGVKLTVAGEPKYEANAYAPTATITLEFTEPVPPEVTPLSIALNTRFGTNNVQIVNNLFERTFGRGILFAGEDLTIENNIFRQMFGTPIQIQADIVENHWAEGKGAANVVIRNNVFENVNLQGRWEGAVVYTGGRLPWGPTAYPLFRKFLVSGNRFVNPPGPAMAFNSSKDFVIRDNTFELNDPFPNATPYARSIFLTLCTHMAVTANTWTNRVKLQHPTGVMYDRNTSSDIHVTGNRMTDDTDNR